MLQRRDELDVSEAAIQELIQTLDQRKDEAIERTFKQVAKNFSEVFLKLVPAGRGKLIMQRRMDQVCPHTLYVCNTVAILEEITNFRYSRIQSY